MRGALLVLLAATASAHEFRPARLDLVEMAPGQLRITWTVEADAAGGELLRPAFDGCEGALDGAGPWTLRCAPNASVRLTGPALATVDVFLRHERLDGRVDTALLGAGNPRHSLATGPPPGVFWRYLVLGVEHILVGADHLLFVLGLVLLVTSTRRLVGAITGFTAGHSVTLAAATLGAVSLPSAPVEACIALSILLLAVELTRADQPLTARHPALLAAGFGLLHGFGFAGVLRDLGLPTDATGLALLAFNVGVELGQLAFVGVLLVVGRVLPGRVVRGPVPAYALGGIAAFWTLQRVAAFA